MSEEALNQALDALRAAQDHLAPSKTDNSELWYKYADAIVAIQSALEQRTWVGLTEEDDIDWEGGNLRDLVKAIEAKLKEKNT